MGKVERVCPAGAHFDAIKIRLLLPRAVVDLPTTGERGQITGDLGIGAQIRTQVASTSRRGHI